MATLCPTTRPWRCSCCTPPPASHSNPTTARNDHRFYQTETTDYYLYYAPDREWLKSDDAMLTPERANQLKEAGRPATVFGAGKYLSQRELTDMGITFCQLPYELFKGG